MNTIDLFEKTNHTSGGDKSNKYFWRQNTTVAGNLFIGSFSAPYCPFLAPVPPIPVVSYCLSVSYCQNYTRNCKAMSCFIVLLMLPSVVTVWNTWHPFNFCNHPWSQYFLTTDDTLLDWQYVAERKCSLIIATQNTILLSISQLRNIAGS